MAKSRYSVNELFDMDKAKWRNPKLDPPRNNYCYLVRLEGESEPVMAMYCDGWFTKKRVVFYCPWPK